LLTGLLSVKYFFSFKGDYFAIPYRTFLCSAKETYQKKGRPFERVPVGLPSHKHLYAAGQKLVPLSRNSNSLTLFPHKDTHARLAQNGIKNIHFLVSRCGICHHLLLEYLFVEGHIDINRIHVLGLTF
jgi:hypothetical protein